jgi:hypothetical protein
MPPSDPSTFDVNVTFTPAASKLRKSQAFNGACDPIASDTATAEAASRCRAEQAVKETSRPMQTKRRNNNGARLVKAERTAA